MKVLVAMSGGVDSSVAAARLIEDGHDVVGVTLKLWGGDSDTGCCSVSDVDDARRTAQQLGVDHLVFNFADDFARDVVGPYVAAHATGLTPNPCIECNRHLKFDRLLRRALALGFDAVATGHHARVIGTNGGFRIGRGADADKDQSYVLYMLRSGQLARILLPIGDLTKAEVRSEASRLGLRTAGKPDSQDVCFITRRDGRERFLRRHIRLRPGRVVDGTGAEVGRVAAVELVTVGQRKGLGTAGRADPHYALAVDVTTATVTVGDRADLVSGVLDVHEVVWPGEPVVGEAVVQCSAHGTARPAVIHPGPDRTAVVEWRQPQRRVAPGQSVVVYRDDLVVGGGIAVS